MQNKSIRFCLKSDKMSTIFHQEFNDLNSLPFITRFKQCAIPIVFKFINGNCLCYLNDDLNNLKKHFFSQMTWFLLTLPLSLILLFIITIITSINIITLIAIAIATVIIILLLLFIILLLSSILLFLIFLLRNHN